MVALEHLPLLSPLVLPRGRTLPGRIAMAPMVTNSAHRDGTVSGDDLGYFNRRSKTGHMIITAAAYVDDLGRGNDRQYGAAQDTHVEGLAELARTIKADGALAILQLYHGGRESRPVFDERGFALGPSTLDFSFLPYPVTGMTERQVQDAVAAFGQAARRAAQAGFDGVEIHGANHYLLQQFFSQFSNHRTDAWGLGEDGRMAFPLAVVDEVLRVVGDDAPPNFIVGYRISPEEVHGSTIGYAVDDALRLVDQVAERGVDYVHTSLWGVDGFKAQASTGDDRRPINDRVRQVLRGRCPLVVVGGITSAAAAIEALSLGDVVAIGSAALCDPDFLTKIQEGRAHDISMDVKRRIPDLRLPKGLKTQKPGLQNSGWPQGSLDMLDAL